MCENNRRNGRPIRVAVIGCGAAGLAMGRHLVARPDTFSVTIFEQTKSVGGTWVYSDRVGTDDYGYPIHSSMYKNLRTILPKEIMNFPDYQFPEDGPSYIDREEVLKYLNNYCDHFSIRPHVKFLTKVIRVSPLSNDEDGNWRVEVQQLDSNQRTVENFDAVSVCNGHYSDPKYPHIPEFEKFEGETLHSHDFRDFNVFADKNVLCFGAGASALDISHLASKVAKQVAICYPPPHTTTVSLKDIVKILPPVTSTEVNGFHFENGEFLQVDIVIFCTGYHYSFPFLSRDCGIAVHQARVTNLYKQLINIKRPTMSFLSIPLMTLPFILSDIQAQFVIKTLTDPDILPPESEMLADTSKEMAKLIREGAPPRYFHRLQSKMWDYLQDLVDQGDLGFHFSAFQKKLYALAVYLRFDHFADYRDSIYKITESEFFLNGIRERLPS